MVWGWKPGSRPSLPQNQLLFLSVLAFFLRFFSGFHCQCNKDGVCVCVVYVFFFFCGRPKSRPEESLLGVLEAREPRRGVLPGPRRRAARGSPRRGTAARPGDPGPGAPEGRVLAPGPEDREEAAQNFEKNPRRTGRSGSKVGKHPKKASWPEFSVSDFLVAFGGWGILGGERKVSTFCGRTQEVSLVFRDTRRETGSRKETFGVKLWRL